MRSIALLAAATMALIAIASDARAADPKPQVSCVEHVPPGATKPKLDDTFPDHATSGYATPLEVTVVHGKGETVLADGFRPGGGEAAKALTEAGFVVADPDGGAGPQITTTPGANDATTKIIVQFVPLPAKPGQAKLTLPPVPISVQRANGEIVTVCTAPHAVVVDEPIPAGKDQKPKANPSPRPQREEWTLAKLVTLGVLIGVLVGVLAGFLLRRFVKKGADKKLEAAPKRLPWLVAIEELEAIGASSLLADGKNDVFFDRVSDCVRKYLGARYGFDGLETTTDEMRGYLRRVKPPLSDLNSIGSFLADCDLVKFAKAAPSEEECKSVLARAEAIVKMTVPQPRPKPVEVAAT